MNMWIVIFNCKIIFVGLFVCFVIVIIWIIFCLIRFIIYDCFKNGKINFIKRFFLVKSIEEIVVIVFVIVCNRLEVERSLDSLLRFWILERKFFVVVS